MAELFIELFSEEIPSKLQINAREKIKQAIEERLNKKEIKFDSSRSFSTPQRLVGSGSRPSWFKGIVS